MLRYSDISVERNFRLIDESVENFTTECDNMISSFDDRCNKALNSGFAFESVEELDFYEEGAKEVIEGIGKKNLVPIRHENCSVEFSILTYALCTNDGDYAVCTTDGRFVLCNSDGGEE